MLSLEIIQDFNDFFYQRDNIHQFIDNFPAIIEVFNHQGLSVFLNKKGTETLYHSDNEAIVGNYNIIEDTVIDNIPDLKNYLDCAFRGLEIEIESVRINHADLPHRLRQRDVFYGVDQYYDVFAFPLKDESDKLAYLVIALCDTKIYNGKASLKKVCDYMHKNWQKKYNVQELAQVAELSHSHFCRIFRQNVGCTPYDYYKQVKISQIKKQLCDPKVSIDSAFRNCGVTYSYRYVEFFKKSVGMTPSQYRRQQIASDK